MGIGNEIAQDWHAALAALAWQVDLGVDEVIGDAPIDRYDLPESTKPAAQPRAAATPAPIAVATPTVDAVEAARMAAGRATTLDALRDALAAFDLCELKKGARNTVFGSCATV